MAVGAQLTGLLRPALSRWGILAGALSDRVGGARLMGIGLMLQAGGLASIAAVSTPTTPYWQLVAPFMVSGIGMAMFWAPVANVVLPVAARVT